MIAYDLQCQKGHTFEGWFKDSKAYQKQKKEGLLSCPVCNDTDIRRIPSTFAIKGAGSTRSSQKVELDPGMMARAIQHYVENNFDNVGADFAKEALKMHYGVSKPRNIRGVSTSQEEETLRQEGISFFKFPIPAADDDPPSSPESESEN